ncbi:type II secretion system F family protein [Halosegnis sp.]|uniref:type II secretion system F family protein n=1 Tax=Halosegnis sp. TaxID=2864959 RepID=UPI0035D43354
MAPLARLSLLALGLLILLVVGVGSRFKSVDRQFNRIALRLFGSYVIDNSAKQARRESLVQAARMGVTYRVYAAKTLAYAGTVALAGSLIGIYAIVLLFGLLAVPQETLANQLPDQLSFLASQLTLPTLTAEQVALLFVFNGATFGAGSGIVTYLYRWYRPGQLADNREVAIDESLPRTVAFMFALARSGMTHKKLIEITGRNSAYFGEAAEELVVSLRDMQVSNADFLNATRRLAQTTPSTEFANFAENLSDVLRTGRSMAEYFREEYEKYKEDRQTRQQQVLEELAALAEGYVALLVAGPLFLITILVIIGLLFGNTLNALRTFVYLIVPMTTAGFIAYLGGLAAELGLDDQAGSIDLDTDILYEASEDDDTPEMSADGGAVVGDTTNLERLYMFNQMRGLRRAIADPIEAAVRSPLTVLYVSTSVAALYVLVNLYLLAVGDGITIEAADDYLIQGTLFVLAPFSVAEYISNSRLQSVERALPDFIDRLADRTEAGMGVTRSIKELDPDSVPGLSEEIRELRADIRLGTKTSEAMVRFASRTESPLAARATVLVVNAVHASGDVAPVLRIAADEAQTDRRLDRRRRQELVIYVLIIYVSFFVFIGIVAALVLVFIPALPSGGELTGGIPSGGGSVPGGVPGLPGSGGGGADNRGAYATVLLHSSVIQGAVSGFTAGKLSQGDLLSGAKHATLMIAIAYAAMLLLSLSV